jgi:hypothetical protein
MWIAPAGGCVGPALSHPGPTQPAHAPLEACFFINPDVMKELELFGAREARVSRSCAGTAGGGGGAMDVGGSGAVASGKTPAQRESREDDRVGHSSDVTEVAVLEPLRTSSKLCKHERSLFESEEQDRLQVLACGSDVESPGAAPTRSARIHS